MQMPQILIGLVAAVSAIDVRGYSGKTCSGNYIVCVNAAPDSCCPRASGNAFGSIGFHAIPTNWNIIGRAFNGGDCRNLYYANQSQGKRDLCLGNAAYSGGNYGFANKKRSEVSEETCAATGSCKSVHRGDLIVFEDGPSYNLTDLDDALYNEMCFNLH